MDLTKFVTSLERLTMAEVRALADDLDGLVATVPDEITMTRTVIALEQAVRRAGVSARAAMAAQEASRAVARVAEQAGVEMPDGDVVRVARAAGQIARGFVAAPHADTELEHLMLGFARLQRRTVVVR